jgi:hypothetical protein
VKCRHFLKRTVSELNLELAPGLAWEYVYAGFQPNIVRSIDFNVPRSRISSIPSGVPSELALAPT